MHLRQPRHDDTFILRDNSKNGLGERRRCEADLLERRRAEKHC